MLHNRAGITESAKCLAYIAELVWVAKRFQEVKQASAQADRQAG